MRIQPGQEAQGKWLAALRTYLVVLGIGDLGWELAQFPLYTIWQDGTPAHMALAMAHGTIGDVFIAAAALAVSLTVFGHPEWPRVAFWRVAIPAMAFGLGFTLYSEWINVEVRHTWAYTDLMPRLPPLGTGLSPFLQWVIVPAFALWAARRRASSSLGR